jgi:serine/threonine protein kinase
MQVNLRLGEYVGVPCGARLRKFPCGGYGRLLLSMHLQDACYNGEMVRTPPMDEHRTRSFERGADNSIPFSCGCGRSLRAKAELKGKRIRCPECKSVLIVPTAAENPEAIEDLLSNSGGPERDRDTLSAIKKSDPDFSFLAPPKTKGELGRLGPYRVLSVLGSGGMGIVFKAEDPGLKRLVAIKAILPKIAKDASAKERFLREARLAARFKHENVVGIHQVGEENGAMFLAMEFLEGESLDARLKREKRLPVAEAVRVGREIAEGLAAAHASGLIHRDVKPANIWLEGDRGRVKILDFGLARNTFDDHQITQPGMLVGTPAYMPPEQAAGKKVDPRCDLYSLGVVFYRMLTGSVPFRGKSLVELINAAATKTPVEPKALNASVPDELNDFILRLLAKMPKDRPASAQEAIAALDSLHLDRIAAKPAQRSNRSLTEQPAARAGKSKSNVRKRPAAAESKSRLRLLLAIFGPVTAAVVAAIVLVAMFAGRSNHPDEAVAANAANAANRPADPVRDPLVVKPAVVEPKKDPAANPKANPEADPISKTPSDEKAPTGWMRYHSDEFGYALLLPGSPTVGKSPAKRAAIGASTKVREAKDCGNIEGELTASAAEALYGVRLQAGTLYCIQLASDDLKTLDPLICLYDAKGNLIDDDDNYLIDGKAKVLFRPTKTEEFLIVARSFENRGIGRFKLAIVEATADQAKAQRTAMRSRQVQLDDSASGLAFLIATTDTKRVIPNQDQALDMARDGALSTVKGKVIWEKKTMTGRNPGRELLVDAEAFRGVELQGVSVRFRLILVGQTFHLLTATGNRQAVEGPAADTFFRSFKLDRDF